MDEFEKKEMSRPLVKNRLNGWYDWLVDYVPKPIKKAVSKAFSRATNSIIGLYNGAKKTSKGDLEGETEKEYQVEEDIDLTSQEHERALEGPYRGFVISGAPKTDIDSYFDQSKRHIKALIKNQQMDMGSAKIIMTLCVRWKKPIMPLIELGSKDVKNAQYMDGSTGDNYTRVEMPFNSLMTEFF